MFEVIYTQSNWTAQNRTFSHLIASLQSSVTRRAMWRMHDAVLTGCSMSRARERARRDTPELMHGLALTNFLDCNTRHVECSTCCVPSSGTHNPTNTTTTATATMKHAEVLNGNSHTNQGNDLIIYLNSLVLNLCLYTVNSATLQRITLKRNAEKL